MAMQGLKPRSSFDLAPGSPLDELKKDAPPPALAAAVSAEGKSAVSQAAT